MKVGVENYWRFNGMKTPSMKATTKVLASFEAGMNSPNLPWHVNITSLKHRSRFGKSLAFAKLNNSTVKFKHFLAVLPCFAKICRESCVEKYKKFSGVDFSSMRARTKVLASFEAGMNSRNLPWHVNITSLKQRSRYGEVPCFRQVE